MHFCCIARIVKHATTGRDTTAATEVSHHKVPALSMDVMGQYTGIMAIATAFHTMEQNH